MAENICEAVYEEGVFRPLATPSDLSEGQRVRLTIVPENADDALALAAKVYEGLSDAQIDEIERIALHRDDFFSDRTENP